MVRYRTNICNPGFDVFLKELGMRHVTPKAIPPSQLASPPATPSEPLHVEQTTKEEEVRWLNLADAALGRNTTQPLPVAGHRARADHAQLKAELEAALDNAADESRRVA